MVEKKGIKQKEKNKEMENNYILFFNHTLS